MPDGDYYVYLDVLESSQSIKLGASVGYRSSRLHATAMGKVFLACMEESQRESILARGDLEKRTKNTITDGEKLRKETEKVKCRGFILDNGESRIEVHRWAAPVFDHLDQLAAVLGIAGPAFRMSLRRNEYFGNAVKRGTEELSRQLGSEKYQRRPARDEKA